MLTSLPDRWGCRTMSFRSPLEVQPRRIVSRRFHRRPNSQRMPSFPTRIVLDWQSARKRKHFWRASDCATPAQVRHARPYCARWCPDEKCPLVGSSSQWWREAKSISKCSSHYAFSYLFRHVRVHAIVLGPLFFCSVDIKARAAAEVVRVVLTFDVDLTCKIK